MSNMTPIAEPVSAEALERELTPDRFLRHTNKGGNMLYVVDGREAPAVMQEVGRQREIAFRSSGGGTGTPCDIDEFDLMDPPCRQLVVWDPDNRLILGGYRFILGPDIRLDDHGQPRLATGHMFRFSQRFIDEYLPHTIELGRSFVRVGYQSSIAAAKTIYALDNLWDGLGALTVLNPGTRYLFGKVTMYPVYPTACRDMVLHFLHKHFPDPDALVRPIIPLKTDVGSPELQAMFRGDNFKEDYRILNRNVRDAGFNIPPLVNAYMSLSPTMRVFGTAINDLFGDVEETGIMLDINDIFEEKKKRHIPGYTPKDA